VEREEIITYDPQDSWGWPALRIEDCDGDVVARIEVDTIGCLRHYLASHHDWTAAELSAVSRTFLDISNLAADRGVTL